MADEKLPLYYGKCPHCGREGFAYVERQWYQGSPVRQCKRCRQTYLDKRYHEVAVEGFEPGSLSVKNSGFMIGAGIIDTVLFGLIHIGEKRLFSSYHLSFVFIAIIGLLLIVMGVIDFIRIVTGLKAKKQKKVLEQSEKRLMDKNYAKLLAQQGYEVPEKYLGE